MRSQFGVIGIGIRKPKSSCSQAIMQISCKKRWISSRGELDHNEGRYWLIARFINWIPYDTSYISRHFLNISLLFIIKFEKKCNAVFLVVIEEIFHRIPLLEKPGRNLCQMKSYSVYTITNNCSINYSKSVIDHSITTAKKRSTWSIWNNGKSASIEILAISDDHVQIIW